MGPPLLAALSAILALYRVTLNLPDVPFSAELRRPHSVEFNNMATRISTAAKQVFQHEHNFYNVTILQFRYNSVVGTSVIFDLTFTEQNPSVEKILIEAVKKGQFGSLTVSPDGFEVAEHQADSLPKHCVDTAWECDGGRCLPWEKRCDGQLDCADQSDEFLCENQKRSVKHHCDENEFRCRTGQCVPRNVECDRRYDCSDGSDELHCDYFANHPHHQQRAETVRESPQELQAPQESRKDCTDQEFQCPSGICIHYERICDARNDCGDNSDEANCDSDELNLKKKCTQYEYECQNGDCIDIRRKCDRNYDCRDGSDETVCDYFNRVQRPTTPPEVLEEQKRAQEAERRRIHEEHLRRVEEAKRERERLEAIQTNQVKAAEINFDDEENAAAGSEDLQITVYPHELSVREGREARFECRARTSDGATFPNIRWTKVGAPLPKHAHESGSELFIPATNVHDAGRYACVAQLNGRSVEAYAQLHVQSYGPQTFSNALPAGPSHGCMADERACGSNECVKSDYVCDGERDCRDGSDEENCPTKRHCEPNEFRCNNDRCVQKMWLCDGDDDCGDRSDEQNCKERKPGDLCQPTEFQCADKRQCVPRSFQCDGTNDCHDGSDEVGCVQPTVVQPPDSNRSVRQGDQFKLTCRAVAVPDPYINWRLNWGPVCEPPRCVQHSEGGVGTLTVNDAQPIDQGAYTCEAINVKGRVLATPDCIVRIVNIPAPPPPTAPPLLSCRAGEYNSPQQSKGCLNCFCFGITNQCQSSNWYRTKEKLYFAEGHSDGVVLTDIEKRPVSERFEYTIPQHLTNTESSPETRYWQLPQRFLGDKISAYGGNLAIQLQYSGSGPVSDEPLIVLKGNGITLVHRPRDNAIFQPNQPVHIQFETYENNFQHLNGQPAQRSDLMMVLADLDTFLIRAKHTDDQTSTSLGDVNWQIAVERDTQEGYALEVEQCACPPGYTGLSCEDCAPGYERSGQGPYLGTCVPIRERPRPQVTCGPGAVQQTSYDRCECKPNVVGPNCDRCAPNTFGLSPQNPQGCNRCWCAGVTGNCDASSFRRAQVEVDYQRGAQDQIPVQTNDIESPFQPSVQPRVTGSSIAFDGFSEARGQPLYWKLPAKFTGDKVTSYGGKIEYTSRCSGSGEPTPDAAVIIRGNNVVLHHQSRQPQTADVEHRVSIPITEQSFTRADGQPASREDLLMALADVDDVLVKSTCVQDTTNSELHRVSVEYAEPYGTGSQAIEVEQCQCPIGYVGPSCEDCAPGYARVQGGPYLGLCQKCECNGHASQCDSQYGTCLNCQHNTEGDHCERCAPGFVGDARRGTPHDCQPEQTRPPCQCYNHSPRGCDSFGRCLLCEHNTEGYHCETCKKGFYGDATRGSPYDCTPCPCPGASDCFLDNAGQVQCRNCPAGYAGRLCDECAPGYTRSQQSGGRDCEPIGRVEPDRVHFVDNPAVPLRVEILAPKHLVIHEGQRAKWTCQVVGHKPENVDVTWTKVGEGELPPHVRVHNTNQIVIDQVRNSDQGQYRCIGTSKIDGTFASDDATLQISRPPALPASPSTGPIPQPVVTPPQQTVNQHQSATFTCLVPGFADCEVVWHFNEINGPLPPGVHRRGNQIFIPQAEQHHVGNYICTVRNQYGQGISNPGHLDVNKPDMRPIADPPVQTVSINDPARFRCWVPGHPDAKISWRPEQGSALPEGVEERDGILNILHAQNHHAQRYICSASDPSNPSRGPVDANPVQLVIKAPDAPVAPQVDPLHQEVPKGSPARFRCWVPGKPDAQVKWSAHGGGALPEGAVDRDGVLEFPSVDDHHAGGYICSVFNPETGQPIDSPIARLGIKQPLKPQVDPREQTVPEGNPARIRCWVDGVPNALLRWNVKGGRPLPAGARDDGRGNLHIDRVSQAHATDYECTAYDPVDRTPTVSEPANIQLQHFEPPVIAEQGRPPRPVATPPVITVKRGDPARFHCDPNSDIPAEVHWGFGSANGPLQGDAHQSGDDIIINAADDSNAGEYYCQATNKFGSGQAEPVKLVIIEDEAAVPPTARVEPKVWNGEPGETHQFKCIVTGEPHPTIQWTGPGGSSLPEGVVDLGEGVLEISKAKKSLHDGDYTCTATNEHGQASDKGTANINPSIKIIIDNPKTETPLGPRIILTVGEPLEIRCTAHGEPDPDVEWLHDPGPERGDLPDDYVPITISEQFIRHPNIGLGNAGRYTCKGSNQFSTVTKDIYVEVVEATARTTVAIIGGSNQFFPTSQPAQILCTATGASLVDKIEWTRVDGGLPEGVEAHNEPGLLHFDSFRDSDAGEYECRAYRKDELIASSTVHVYSDHRAPTDVAHVEISAPSVRVVNKGDSIVLDCLVHGGHDSELKYRWSLARGGSVIRQLGEEAQLTIKAADPTNDYGIYRCEVDNDEGDTLGSAQAAVSVGYDASTNPEEAKFEEESEAVLICPVFTVPGATVTWYKHSGELPEDAVQNGNKLTIPLFTEDTAGLYTCTVQYGQSTVEGYVNAKIFVPDTTIQVVLNVSSESVREGDRVWLDCVVTGDPTAKIEFSKIDADALPAGAQVTECDDLAQEKKVTGNRLLFTSVTPDDAGKYQCRAHITGGFLDTSALLSVEAAKRSRNRWPLPPVREQGDQPSSVTSYMEPIDEILTTTQASFARVTYTTPYTTLYSLSPSASAQAVVGETANLPCRAYGVNSYDSRISWEKLDDVMPSQFRISDTSLLIPKVKKADAGTYRCIVDTVDGQNHLAIAELIVGDYIPTFDGSRIIEITPLTHEQWQRLDLEVSFRPSKENGVIYHAERHVHSSEPQLFHNIAMRKGHVVYTFDIGSGVSRVQSPVSIKMGEWSKVRIRNDDKKVSLNVNQQTSGHSRNAPLPNIKETNDGTVYLGGIPEYSGHYDQLKRPDNFAGSISKLVVNGKSIDIGESATSPPEVILQLSTNECFENPCQNAAQCSPAHELEGFRCQCEPEFTGELCQFRTAVCANREVCQHGVCVDADWGEYRCVCPYGRFGKYCEHLKTDLPLITYDKMGRARQGVKFNGKTSFISIPAPQSSRHFRLSFDILPKNVKSPQLLAYVASSYNSKKADYMALVVQNEALYGLYHTSQGTERIQSYGRIQPNKTHEIGFLHSGSTLELLVDGRRTMQTLHSPVFSTGTALYIGGLAPGMSPIEELDSYGYFEGCLSSIRVNRQLIEVDSTRDVKSGDLGECSLNTEEVLVTSSPGVVRPIYIPPSRPGNEYLTPGESQPNSEHYQESVTMKPDRTLEPMAITHLMGSEDERIPRVTELPTTTMEAPKEKTTIEKTTETTSTSAILATTPSTTTTSTTSTTPAATTTITIEEATTRQTLQYDWTPPPTTIEQSPTATTLTPISEEPTTTEGSIWWVNEAPAATTTQFPSTEPPTNPSTTIHVITKDQPLYTTVIQPKTTTTTAEYPTKSSTISTAPHSVLPSSYTSPPTHHVLPPDQTAPPPTSNPYLTHSQNLETTRYTELISTDLQLTPTYQAKPTMVSYEEEDLVSTDIIRPTVERLDEVRTGLCEDADCGEHGICEAVNTTHVACACRDYYVGPNCDQFKPIEYAARFEGNAFIVFSVDDFPHLTSEKREIIEFRFRTTAEYGLMLWQGQSLDNSIVGEDYVSIGLNDGFLVFSYELGGGAAQITSEMPVNDGKEHYLRVERRGRNGSLIIDNQEPVEGRSSGILAMLNVEGNIYIGGLPDLATMTAGLHSHNFVGCIADLRLNEDPLDLMGNAIDGRNVKPCEGWTRKRKWLQQKYRRFLRHG